MFDALFNTTPGQIEVGSVGWEDSDDFFFAGEETNDGHTLVRVQLFRGRDHTQPISARAQGVKIVCCVADGVVPKKDARCYVAIPHGMDDSPGAGVIMAVVSVGNEVRRNISAGDKVFAPDGGQGMIIAKTDGSVTIHSTDNNDTNGNSVFVRVSPTAIQFVAPWGRMIFDASGVHWVTKSGARLDMGGISVPGIPGAIADSFTAYAKLTAPMVKLAGGTVFLGQGTMMPAVFTPAPLPTTGTVGVVTAVPGPQVTLMGSPSVWMSA